MMSLTRLELKTIGRDSHLSLGYGKHSKFCVSAVPYRRPTKSEACSAAMRTGNRRSSLIRYGLEPLCIVSYAEEEASFSCKKHGPIVSIGLTRFGEINHVR